MNVTNSELMLYSRQHCHLCDLAEQMLLALDPQPVYRKIDIADDVQLLRQYGSAIPVLRAVSTAAELRWPFTADSLLSWLLRQQQMAS